MVNHAGEFEVVVAASPAGFVQLVCVRLGTALQYVGLVAVFQLLLLCLLALVALAFLESMLHHPNATTTIGGYTESSKEQWHTYRSPAKEYLWRFPAPHALEELVDDVVGHFHLHGLHRRRSVSDVAIRGSNEGNTS